MATLSDFRTRVAQKIGMDTGNSTELALIDSWVNEGVLDFTLRTGCKIATATMSLTADEEDYELPTAILLITELWLSSSTEAWPFERVSDADIVRLRRASASTTSTGARRYAVSGSNLLMIWPTPSSAETVNVVYVPRPATLSATTDTPSEIPLEFHKAVELYALAEAADFDDDQSSAQGQRYREEYDKWVVKARKYVNRKGGQRLGRAVVGRRRPFPVHPSTDTGW